MSKHTNGPWTIYDCLDMSDGYLRVTSGHSQMVDIADVVNDANHHTDISMEEARANARLIAAAPEMYEALKEFMLRCGSKPFEEWNINDIPWKQMQAAIDKAKPEIRRDQYDVKLSDPWRRNA